MGRLEGKTAVITGANSGIGLASAKRFVAEGAYVYIIGRRQEELDKAVRAIGTGVLAVQGDVSHLDDLDRLFSKVRLDQGHIDVLFANAGLGAREPLGKITESSSHRRTGLQTRGSGNSCRAKQGTQAQPAGAAVRLDNNREAFR
jgi:NAD(P)-dependent dehydrogenase (short-subunit alcohol dehydrogenase family)